jgi:hypothetical protein
MVYTRQQRSESPLLTWRREDLRYEASGHLTESVISEKGAHAGAFGRVQSQLTWSDGFMTRSPPTPYQALPLTFDERVHAHTTVSFQSCLSTIGLIVPLKVEDQKSWRSTTYHLHRNARYRFDDSTRSWDLWTPLSDVTLTYSISICSAASSPCCCASGHMPCFPPCKRMYKYTNSL